MPKNPNPKAPSSSPPARGPDKNVELEEVEEEDIGLSLAAVRIGQDDQMEEDVPVLPPPPPGGLHDPLGLASVEPGMGGGDSELLACGPVSNMVEEGPEGPMEQDMEEGEEMIEGEDGDGGSEEEEMGEDEDVEDGEEEELEEGEIAAEEEDLDESLARGPESNEVQGFGNGGFGNGGVRAERAVRLQLGVEEMQRREAASSSRVRKGGPSEDTESQIWVDRDGFTRGKGHGPPGGKGAEKWYLVAQVREGAAILARIDKSGHGWPELALVKNELIPAVRPLEIGDSVKVAGFEWAGTETGWAERGGWLFESNFRLNYQAVVTQASACQQGHLKDSVGLAVHVERDRRGDHRMKSALVASIDLPGVMKAFRRHLPEGVRESELRYRQPVALKLNVVTRPEKVWVSQHYLLPPGFPARFGNEFMANQPCVVAEIKPMEGQFVFPFEGSHSWEMVERGEAVMGAALAAQTADVQQELRKWTLVVELTGVRSVGRSEVLLSFRKLVPSLAQLTAMHEIWVEDTAVSCKVDEHEDGKPCAAGYVTMVRKHTSAVGYAMEVEVVLGHQEAKGRSNWPEFDGLASGEYNVVELRPMVSTSALRDRSYRLGGKVCSQLAKDTENPTGRLMAILLGRRVQRMAVQQIEGGENVMELGPLSLLTGGQRETAKLMLDPHPRVVFQQAPPGTGKTYTAAMVMTAIRAMDPNARILALAPPNVAVVKMVLETRQAQEVAGVEEKMIALFSGSGKVNYAAELSRIVPHLLATAVEAEEFEQVLKEVDEEEGKKARRTVSKYLRACAESPRMAQEAAVARILKEHAERKITFATLAFAEQVAGLFEDTTVLVLDEAGQVSYAQLLSLLAQLPRVRKVLITGDRRQLGVHLPSLPLPVRQGFGLGSVIDCLDRAEGVDTTVLTVCYRSHPAIVRSIEVAFYRPHGEVLEPGRTAEQRAFLTGQTAFKLPARDSPAILIHQMEEAEPDAVSMSSTNPAQTRSAMMMLWRLCESLPVEVTIRCVCMYATQAGDIARLAQDTEGMERVLVSTTDACQGHESDIVVVVTTCSQYAVNEAGEEPFWARADRAVVALSRARHGYVVIGNLLLLNQASSWNKFLQQAMQETVVVAPDYLDIIRQQGCRYDAEGKLLDKDGRPAKDELFYRRLQGGNQGQGGAGGPSGSGGGASRYRPYLPQARGRGRGGQRR